MQRIVGGILALVLGLSVVAWGEGRDKAATPAEQYKALLKEWSEATHAFWNATTAAERGKIVARVDKLLSQVLELAEKKNPKDPVALEALIQVVVQEIWLENYAEDSLRSVKAKDSPGARAMALLLRDHVESDKLGEACRRIAYGFRKECEMFLRTAVDKSPHKDVQAQACLRLAQFLSARLQRLDLVKDRPEMAKRYEVLFGKNYVEALERRDHAEAVKEAEAVFERAAAQYGDVKLPFGGTVGERAKAELFELRHLSVGKEAPDIEGEDQDGKRFKLSDYRGKVVLLYFWQQI